MRITRRMNESVVADWRADPAVVKTRARLAELDALLAAVHDKLHMHDGAIAGTAQDLERAEMEVLAGRSSDAALAAKQASHLEARRQRAKTVIQSEDAEAERAKLQATLPALEKKAKQAAHDAIQVKAIGLLKEMRAAIAVMSQAEGDYVGLVAEAESQFPLGVADPHQRDHYDTDFAPRAGLGHFTETRTNGFRQDVVDLAGATARFAQEIDQALAYLEGRLREQTPEGKR